MQPKIDINGKRVWVLELQGSTHFSVPFQTQPFPCLVLAAEQTDQELKDKVAKRIIDAGCRYVVCAGVECEAWHDAMDDVAIEVEMAGDLSQDETVMTTWHEDESIEDIAFFFALNTFMPESRGQMDFHELLSADYLVLLVGESDEKDKLINRIGYYLEPGNEPPDEDA